MPEGESPDLGLTSLQPPKKDQTTTKNESKPVNWSDAIEKASSPQEALKAYHENRGKLGGDQLASMQIKLGERLGALGDIQSGITFTALGEQTFNVLSSARVAEIQHDLTSRLGAVLGDFSQNFEQTGRNITGGVSHAAEDMTRASHNMLNAADSMNKGR